MVKRYLANVLDATGATEALLRAKGALLPSWMPVLTYHRIHPHAEEQPFDRRVIDATPDELRRQMTMVRAYFTPIGVSDLLAHLDGRAKLPPRPILVTFDDGYKECITQALPILLSTGVKATFFVATGYIGGKEPFWWDRIASAVEQTSRTRLVLSYPEPLEINLARGRDRALQRLLWIAKTTYALDFGRFLEDVSTATGVSRAAQGDGRKLVMSWNDVRALRYAGMEAQSHTRSHRVLANIHADELRDELIGSREDLGAEIGQAPRAISYPVGMPITDRPDLMTAVRSAGYALGFSTGTSWPDRRTDPLDMGRTMLDRGMSDAMFRSLLLHPMFASA